VEGEFATDHTLALKGAVWMHPTIRDGMLYILQGEGCRSFSYTHWPAATVECILAFDLKTGKERWVSEWPKDKGDPPVAYNMTCGEGVLALATRTGMNKGKLQLLLVDAKTGRIVSYQDTGKGRKEIGGGHSHARALINGGNVWVSTIYGASRIGLADPANSIDKAYDGLRPVGCTVWRATPKWHIGSLTLAALDGSGYYWTDAHRTHCDVGAFPANGLLYITPNRCGCQPYQPGSNAAHSRLLSENTTLERLERGAAKAAPPRPGGGWPTLLRDNLRSAWSDEKLPRALAVAWQTQVSAAPATDAMLQREWDNQYYTNGPVTAASVAEGVCVLAAVHRQQVVALDAATGKERWRITVDGRVESQPTIHRGLVLFGTRNGHVIAVNRDTGERVWRFLAAPSTERIVANGQLESVWPVFGSVVAEGDDVWAFAGRHSDLDGGIWWWRLSLDGDVRAKGRLGYDELRRAAKEERPIRMANMPPVYDGKRFYFAQQYLERRGDTLVPWDEGQGRTGHEWDNWAARAKMNAMIPANTGTLQDGRRLRALNAASHYYGGVRAKQFCYRGDDYVSLLGTLEKGNRGGNIAASILRMRRLGPDEAAPKKGVAAVPVWTGVRVSNWIGKDGYKACAVAGDRVLVGWSMEGSDSHSFKEPRHRLKVLDYATGKETQDDVPVPAPILYAGIAVADGAVYVVSEDGTVTCMR
ncbi:PQQ-binding-like beta-propeller repeat protein, partial [bacterium]|nr:PQQ-binding-like beta-propeller repeat protein [bacterium]